MSHSTDYSLSLLDMLCAAMGGVALLVFIFAAMRKNIENQAEGASEMMVLEVKTDEGYKGAPFCVGKEISFYIHEKGNDNPIAELGDDGIVPASVPSTFFKFRVTQTHYIDNAIIVVWLRELPDDPQQLEYLKKNRKIICTLLKNTEILVNGELTNEKENLYFKELEGSFKVE
jgi:hypothetical protein